MANTAVKISNELAQLAKAAAKSADRSMAGQIEHWARLGAAVDDGLTTAEIASLKGRPFSERDDQALVREIDDRTLDMPFTPIRERLLQDSAPLYWRDPGQPGRIAKTDASGATTYGRMDGKTFNAAVV